MAMADLLNMNDKRSADKQKALDSALAQIERRNNPKARLADALYDQLRHGNAHIEKA